MSLMQNLPGPGSRDRADDPATHDARELIPDGVQSKIVLDGKTYTLRITRAGKLILTK